MKKMMLANVGMGGFQKKREGFIVRWFMGWFVFVSLCFSMGI